MTTSAEWPPPADELLIIDGTMVSPATGVNDDGASPVVLVRMGAHLPGSDVAAEHDVTYVVDIERVAGLLTGLIGSAHAAFGRGAVQRLVADSLGISPELRDKSVDAVNDALDGLL
jgi:hypothetical protein